MSNESIKSSKRVLEPSERISEVLFGLIMVLTFTGSLSIAEVGREEFQMLRQDMTEMKNSLFLPAGDHIQP